MQSKFRFYFFRAASAWWDRHHTYLLVAHTKIFVLFFGYHLWAWCIQLKGHWGNDNNDNDDFIKITLKRPSKKISLLDGHCPFVCRRDDIIGIGQWGCWRGWSPTLTPNEISSGVIAFGVVQLGPPPALTDVYLIYFETVEIRPVCTPVARRYFRLAPCFARPFNTGPTGMSVSIAATFGRRPRAVCVWMCRSGYRRVLPRCSAKGVKTPAVHDTAVWAVTLNHGAYPVTTTFAAKGRGEMKISIAKCVGQL